ncbi:MAG: hypothetical protein RL722_1800 [Pseudomonadota bacterium]|jgi:hypothetical protein
MWMSVFLLPLLLCLALTLVAVHQRLGRYQVVARRSWAHGWGWRELRRQTRLERTTPDDFPRPREERLVVIWLCGVPLCCHCASVGLPIWADACIDQVAASEADAGFLPPYRLAAWQQLA